MLVFKGLQGPAPPPVVLDVFRHADGDVVSAVWGLRKIWDAQ